MQLEIIRPPRSLLPRRLGRCYGPGGPLRLYWVLSIGCDYLGGHRTAVCYVVWSWRGPRRLWLR